MYMEGGSPAGLAVQETLFEWTCNVGLQCRIAALQSFLAPDEPPTASTLEHLTESLEDLGQLPCAGTA